MTQLERIKCEVYDSTPEALPKSARILYFTDMARQRHRPKQNEQSQPQETPPIDLEALRKVIGEEVGKELKKPQEDNLKATREGIQEDYRNFLKKLTTFLLGIGFIVAFFVYTYVPTLVGDKVGEKVGNEIKEVNKELGSIKERLVKLELTNDLLPRLREKTAGSVEELKKSLPEATNLLRTAETKEVVVNPELLAEIGTSLLRREISDPEVATLAWNTTNQFINYRTFLNEQLYVPPMNLQPRSGMNIFIAPGTNAEFHESYFRNITVGLDRGKWIGNVFKGCVIKYSGDSAMLKNNVFIDCDFQIAATPSGRVLAQGILKSLSPEVEI